MCSLLCQFSDYMFLASVSPKQNGRDESSDALRKTKAAPIPMNLARRALLVTCTAAYVASAMGQSRLPHSPEAELATADVQVYLAAGDHTPRLTHLASHSGAVWQNQSDEILPTSVTIKSASVPVVWSFKRHLSSVDDHRVSFVYESTQPHLRVRWEWEARASFGPIEHHITVENLGDEEVWLPLIDSLNLDWHLAPGTALNQFYVEKGADTPSPHGTHLESVTDGYRWMGRSSTYAHPVAGKEREMIPVEFVYSAAAPHAGWYAGIEFSGRTRITLDRKSVSLQSKLGLNPDLGTFRTRVLPKGRFETPTVFLGAFQGGPDDAANQLRPWVRAVLNNPLTWKDPQYPLLVNNSWGSGMQVDEPLALRMIAESKELGLEMFHLDAGWFRSVGDWYPDPRKFPHGLAPLADAAHRQSLRFGLWVDWAQAGLDTAAGALNARDPKMRDWLVNDLGPNWKPEEFKGQTIDIGLPAAHDYAAKEVKRIVEDYHLDMLEHDGYLVAQACTRDDHPHAPLDPGTLDLTHDSGFDFDFGSNSTDVSYHAVRAYYDIYERLRREHPGLLLEICNDGGRMIDFGTAAHGDYFSITDTYDPLSNRRAFYDTSFAMPAAMLESYIEKWPTPRIENFLYMLRSGMMGWTTIMLDTTAWSAEQHDAAKGAFALYKRRLRPFIRDAQLYHVSPRPDGIHWDALQYWNPAQKKGVVFVFRGTAPDEPEHSFILAGLNPHAQYQLHFEDGSTPDHAASGSDLLQNGLTIHLNNPLSSELVFLQETPNSGKGGK